MRGGSRIAAVLISITLGSGCASTFRSTDGARRESRRECLALARSVGWNVTDISNARWLGAGQHEVLLTVERRDVSPRVLRCVYDTRTGLAAFAEEPRRP